LASLLISTLDAIGILLIIPLVEILASDGDSTTATVPVIGDFIGEVSALGLIIAIVVFFVAKTLGAALIRWWSTGVVQTAGAREGHALFRQVP
jgi:hypothetical protein